MTTQARDLPVMDGQSKAFFLKQETGVARDEWREPVLDLAKPVRGGRVSVHNP